MDKTVQKLENTIRDLNKEIDYLKGKYQPLIDNEDLFRRFCKQNDIRLPMDIQDIACDNSQDVGCEEAVCSPMPTVIGPRNNQYSSGEPLNGYPSMCDIRTQVVRGDAEPQGDPRVYRTIATDAPISGSSIFNFMTQRWETTIPDNESL